MPTRDEILQRLIDGQAALDARITALEDAAARESDPWAEEFAPGKRIDYDLITNEGTLAPHPDAGDLIADPGGVPAASPERNSADDPDEDTPQVIEARARLEQGGQAIAPRPSSEVQIDGQIGTVTVTVPDATPNQRLMRTSGLGKSIIANLPKISPEDAAKFYEAYGPIWLYNFDRHHVVELPINLRTEMLKDVMLTAPVEAQKMARDILRADDEEQQAWAMTQKDLVREEAERRGG